MNYLVLVISIYVFFKTISYGIYEIKKNSNYYGGITIIVIAILCAFYPNLLIYFKGT